MSLRSEIRKWADRAKEETGRPGTVDVAVLKSLWEKRKEIGVLSDQIPSNYKLRWNRADPDWGSWSSIAKCLEEYHAALVDRDNRAAPGMAAIRLQGI